MADQHPDTKPATSAGAAADGWDACTWDGARRDVLHRAARMTFREKVIWLEEATRLALTFLPAPSPAPPGDLPAAEADTIELP